MQHTQGAAPCLVHDDSVELEPCRRLLRLGSLAIGPWRRALSARRMCGVISAPRVGRSKLVRPPGPNMSADGEQTRK